MATAQAEIEWHELAEVGLTGDSTLIDDSLSTQFATNVSPSRSDVCSAMLGYCGF